VLYIIPGVTSVGVGVESVWCVLAQPTRSLVIGCCYRPPDSSEQLDTQLLEQIESIVLQHNNVIIMGDFNAPHMDWSSSTPCNHTACIEHRLTDTMHTSNLNQIVDFPTRYRHGDTPRTLDLVMVTESIPVEGLAPHTPLGKSDHVVLAWTVNVPLIGTIVRSSRLNYARADYEGLRSFFSSIDWSNILIHDDLDTNWKAFLSLHNEAVQRFVPMRGASSSCKQPAWFTHDVREHIANRNVLWKQYKQALTANAWESYKVARNWVTTAKRNAKSAYELNLTDRCKSDPKLWFKYVNRTNKKNTNPYVVVGGKPITEPREVANELGNFFGSTFTIEDDKEYVYFEDW
jgi:hypothetical protein